MRMERRWFPRCRECPTPVVRYRDVGSCSPRFCSTSEGFIATWIGAKTLLYRIVFIMMRAFLSWRYWLLTQTRFSCKLTLLMIRCDHDDDLDSSHEEDLLAFGFDHPGIGVEWSDACNGAVQRKEHHRVPGHHLHHARRLPYAQLWHSRPRVHSNKEVRIYVYCCPQRIWNAVIFQWNTIVTFCLSFFQGYKKLVHALRAVGGGSACGMHHRQNGRRVLLDGAGLRHHVFGHVLWVQTQHGQSQKVSLSWISKARSQLKQTFQIRNYCTTDQIDWALDWNKHLSRLLIENHWQKLPWQSVHSCKHYPLVEVKADNSVRRTKELCVLLLLLVRRRLLLESFQHLHHAYHHCTKESLDKLTLGRKVLNQSNKRCNALLLPTNQRTFNILLQRRSWRRQRPRQQGFGSKATQ